MLGVALNCDATWSLRYSSGYTFASSQTLGCIISLFLPLPR